MSRYKIHGNLYFNSNQVIYLLDYIDHNKQALQTVKPHLFKKLNGVFKPLYSLNFKTLTRTNVLEEKRNNLCDQSTYCCLHVLYKKIQSKRLTYSSTL